MSTKAGQGRQAGRKKAAPAVTRKRSATKATSARGGRGVDARVVAVEILNAHGGEMAVKELADLVVADRRVTLGGKTPAATVAAKIYTAAKAGNTFRKTDRGKIALLEPAESSSPAAAVAASKKAKGKAPAAEAAKVDEVAAAAADAK